MKKECLLTSNRVACIMTIKKQRRVRAAEVTEVGLKMGKYKIKMHEKQCGVAMYWNEEEVKVLEELL